MNKVKQVLEVHLKGLEDLVGSKGLMALIKGKLVEDKEGIHLEIFLKNSRNFLEEEQEDQEEVPNNNPK